MIQTICLHRVLREAVTTPYRNLVTRATGALVRSRIEAQLAASASDVTVLDFSEVELLDFSCADEIVAKLVLPAGRPVVLLGVRDEQREALDHVLAHHGVALTARLHLTGEAVLLGAATPDLHQAFEALCGRGASLDDFARLPIS